MMKKTYYLNRKRYNYNIIDKTNYAACHKTAVNFLAVKIYKIDF
jgi:hypothetical protein